MGLKKVLKGMIIGLDCLCIGLSGYLLYTIFDFSNVRSEKHQIAPIIRQVEDMKGEKYAVLVSADGKDWFKENITFGYRSLLRAGFNPDNIYVLSGHDDVGSYNRGEATQENLQKVFDELKVKVDNDDSLLLYMTNHGGKEYLFIGESEVEMDGRNVTASNLNNMFSGINPNYAVAIFTQCEPREFLDYFGQNNRIAISASRGNKATFKNYFSIAFFEGLGGEDKEGRKVNPDSNNDGRLSIEELFEYTSRNDERTILRWHGCTKETPQMYWQNANPRDLYIR